MISRILTKRSLVAASSRMRAVRTTTTATTTTGQDFGFCELPQRTIGINNDYRDATTAETAAAEAPSFPYSHQQHPLPTPRHYGSLQDGPREKFVATAAWQAANNANVQQVTVKAMIYELINQQAAKLEATVPWFLENMPQSYFYQVPESFRMDHIKAIAAIKDANMDLYLNLQSNLSDGRQVLTFVRPSTKPGTLLQMVQELPKDEPLSRLHVFSAADQSMALNLFVYGSSDMKLDHAKIGHLAAPIFQCAKDVQAGKVRGVSPDPCWETAALRFFAERCTETHLQIGSAEPLRFLRHVQLVDHVADTDGTEILISHENTASESYWVDVAVANSVPQVVLENLCRLLYVHGLDVTRARLDTIPTKDGGSVTLLRTLVTPLNDDDDWKTVLPQELKRAKWLDPTTYELALDRFPGLGVTRAEVITGLCAAIHPVLAKTNALAYSNTNLFETVCNPRFIGHATSIADLFLDRFRPESPLADGDFAERCESILSVVESDVEDTVASTALSKMLNVVQHTLKTNVYMPDRYALSLRLDPACMADERELPYGVVFVHGRRFNGFHVRFRDIARGGLRLVTPASAEQYALESARQYDECYGLAYAQQLKNKDIPEGGSKAVNLIKTEGLSEEAKFFVMRKSVKAMADSILDLIVTTDYTEKHMVDLWGKKEVLYLGPDEQVLPEDIEWIVKRAAQRGYDTPAAFMSSKPRAGINHKQYGVTSEGVNVYLDVALRQVLNIDPTNDSFSLKMTGGPDGDVAGNEIKILIREYGKNVKIVGIADHSGCAEDPDGLDHQELLRLVSEGLCISNFNPSSLSGNGSLRTVETPQGVNARNSMHNRLEADAFLPCGGRPNTIDITNYKQFLREDGTPSSPLIVEGANLFVTADARQALFDDAGVAIVKDSSANKGGVITSSYEICAAMLLSEDEFFENKEKIVGEVLEKLRSLAKMEAELLFREFEDYDGLSLPKVSQIISDNINVTTDSLTAVLDSLPEDDINELVPLFRTHLPPTIVKLSSSFSQVPEQYIKNAIASCLASKMVYKEGTKFIAAQNKKKLASVALSYVQKEKEVAALMETISGTDMPGTAKATVLRILEEGGARTALRMKKSS